MPTPEGFREGARVGPYVIESLVGTGGFAMVFRARDTRLGRHVAIKVVDDEAGALEAQLVGEARSLARLSHPNIVGVFDVGVTADDRVWVAMEFIDGVTIDRWSEGRSWREVLAAWVSVADAFRHAHEVGVLHRDIKPANVMVDPAGRARVLDFGIVRDRDGQDRSSLLHSLAALGVRAHSDAGAVVGTIGYMAPEVFRGQPIDPLTEQFSLCVAIYRTLYGVDPYEHSVRSRWPREVPVAPSPRRTRPEVPPVVEDILLRGMDPDRERRWPSISILAARLDAALETAVINPLERERARVHFAATLAIVGLGLLGWIRFSGPERFGALRLLVVSIVTACAVLATTALLRKQLFRTPYTRKLTIFANLLVVTELVHHSINAWLNIPPFVTLSSDVLMVAAASAYLGLAHDRIFFAATLAGLIAGVGCAALPLYAPLVYGLSQGVALLLYAYRALGVDGDGPDK